MASKDVEMHQNRRGCRFSLLGRLRVNKEVLPYLLLMVGAAVLRFWDLDLRAMHYDESLHAYYSWKLFTGLGYDHEPWMHGPFQFYGTWPIYWLFGASDYAARVLPALFGTILVGLPYFLRGYLGRMGGLVTAMFFVISPTILYFSRFARNDIYILVWTLALVICLWRYLEERRSRYLYLSAAFLGLGFCTKETTYVTLAIFSSFLFILVSKELISRLRDGLNLFASFAPAAYLVLMATLALPLFAAAVAVPLRWLGANLPRWQFAEAESVNVGWAISIGVLLFIIAAVIGLRWRWRIWLLCAVIFWGIFGLFYTSFFHNTLDGIASGVWGSFDYWLVVHGEERIDQPWYYYLMILSIYEFLPLIFAIAGGIYYAIKGDLFSRFLVYWAAAGLIFYAVVGEKPPWLVLHLALPLILLGGKFLGELLSRVRLGLGWRNLRYSALLLLIIPLVILTGRAAWQASLQHQERPTEMLVYAQGAPEVADVAAEIGQLAGEMGIGNELEVTLDSTINGVWVWPWYLREYDIDWLIEPDSISGPPGGSVLILGTANVEKAKPYLEKYGEGRRIRTLMWFPESYKEMTPGKFLRNIISLEAWKNGWRYFLYRETWCPSGSGDAMVYFPKGYAPNENTRGGDSR